MHLFLAWMYRFFGLTMLLIWQDNILSTDAVQGCSIIYTSQFKWKRAICDSVQTRLNHIPSNLPVNLIDLRVTHQHIPAVSTHGLRSLIHLETLRIESSAVSRITPDAFDSLVKLKHLSLRNNSLRLGLSGLPKEALDPLRQLETLDLSDNPIDIIPDSFFASPGIINPLQSLRIGPVKGTTLHVDPNSFKGLTHLRLLDLGYSRLSSLSPDLVQTFQSMRDLHTILLDGNPWHCDCKLRWLHTWLRLAIVTGVNYRRVQEDRQIKNSGPSCITPEKMYGRVLGGNDSSPTDFVCPAKLLTDSQNVTAELGESTTLKCAFYADPFINMLWYKDGILVRNTSRTSIFTYKSMEKFISALVLSYVETSDGGHWRCSLEQDPNVHSAVYFLTVIRGEGSLLAGMSATQQNWIFAGLGVGGLFLLLISFGIGIFYCCDPRSHSERSLHRWVSKRQTERLQNCYGCDKSTGHRKSLFRKNACDGSKEEDQNTEEKPLKNSFCSDGKDSPLKNICTPSVVCLKPINSNHRNSIQASVNADGSVIHNTVPMGGNRLLVSCDGPEPTVLLATRISPTDSVLTPATVHEMQTPFTRSQPTCSTLGTVQYVVNTNISSPNRNSHIYAHLIPASSIQKSSSPQVMVTQSIRTQFTTPCPLHGSIDVSHHTDSLSSSPGKPYSVVRTQASNELAQRNKYSHSTNPTQDCRNFSSAHEYDSSSDTQDRSVHPAKFTHTWTGKRGGRFAERSRLPGTVAFQDTRDQQSILPDSFDYGDVYQQNVGRKMKSVTIQESQEVDELSGSNGSVISVEDVGNEKGWDTACTTTSSDESTGSNCDKQRQLASNLPDVNYFHPAYFPPCALHQGHWRGYSSQMISPASGSTRSTVYSAATLPSRIQPREPQSILKPSSYRFVSDWNLRNRSNSQTSVRPGSKRKLDTDSGTE